MYYYGEPFTVVFEGMDGSGVRKFVEFLTTLLEDHGTKEEYFSIKCDAHTVLRGEIFTWKVRHVTKV